MRLFTVAILWLSLAAQAYSADVVGMSSGNMNMALGEFYKCMHRYALRFATTKESPSDIAEGALSECHNELHAVPRASVLDRPEAAFSPTENEGMMQTVAQQGKRLAIHSILEARYPQQTKK
jgi:hypothetical protein